ncbi:hypothetical protein BD413DRAFT_311290 [Trametes elegans]|nr:hypothetical protein BD413DRAFT_311290 [Trametes elegans]
MRRYRELLAAKEKDIEGLKELMKQREDASQAKIDSLQQEIEELRVSRKADEQRYRDAERYAQDLNRRVVQLEQEVRLGNAAKIEWEKAQAQAKVERRDVLALLDTRTAELKEAQTYLSKVDDVSDSDVLRLVERINSQIFQTAAKISEDLQPSYGMQTDVSVIDGAVSSLKKSTLAGPELPHILRASNHRDDPIFVQIALQVVLTTFLYHLASPWTTMFDKRAAHLQSIYAEMCQHEPQSVFGRWRTITLTYLHALIPDNANYGGKATLRLVDHVSDVLLACGVDGSPESLRELVRRHYGKGLRQLVAHVLDLQHITGERTVSRDLQLLVFWPGTPFSAAVMEDEWADTKGRDGTPAPNDPVFCTTNLGLVRRERRTEPGSAGVQGWDTMREVELLKPKIMLESSLRRLVAESMTAITGHTAA